MSGSREAAPVDFVIVGAQRAASTYLNACLRAHPRLYLCPDEVPYFEDPFFANTPVEELERVFADAEPGQRRGIQRPDYLGRPECAGNIHALAPDARILAVLRDPVDRAVSAYFWYVQFGLLPLLPPTDGIRRLLDGWTDPAYPRAGEILEFGHYARHLRRYVDTFGAGRVLALRGASLREPAGLAPVYAFLGVDPAFRPPAPVPARNAGVYDLRRLRLLRLRRRFAWSWDGVRTYRYQPRRLRRPFALLPTAAILAVDRLVLTRVLGNERPSLSPRLRERLGEAYAADQADLEALLTEIGTARTR